MPMVGTTNKSMAPTSSIPLKNAKNEAFFSVGGRLLGWRIREFEVCWLGCSQFGDADQVVGDQIEHEVGGDATNAAVFGLAHGPVLLTPTEDAFGHRPA